jgi:hypothetical protein
MPAGFGPSGSLRGSNAVSLLVRFDAATVHPSRAVATAAGGLLVLIRYRVMKVRSGLGHWQVYWCVKYWDSKVGSLGPGAADYTYPIANFEATKRGLRDPDSDSESRLGEAERSK